MAKKGTTKPTEAPAKPPAASPVDKPTAKGITATPKSKQEIEEVADKARKAKVDAANKKRAAETAEQEAKLAKTPLSAEEKAFIERIAPKMNEGRAIMQPSPAEMLRYSQLIKRKDVNQKTITD